jgi:hypothetical protein
MLTWPKNVVIAGFRFVCLLVCLAVAASIPILQWAALGYLLEVSRRRATGRPWRETLPGLAIAGKLGWVFVPLILTWLPAWLLANFAFQAELIDPGSDYAARWRTVAMVVGFLWIIHATWALIRGGRWRDFLWPAPIRFLKEFFRPSTWRRVEDQLWDTLVSLQIPRLIWLGFRGWIGALAWLAIPAGLIIIGIRSDQRPIFGLISLVGFLMMWVVLLYLPFLQTSLAVQDRLRAMFTLTAIREAFKHAPWAFFISLLVTLALAIPLYLLRIETLPRELLWIPCLVFILFGLPSRIALGWAMKRGTRDISRRWLINRYVAWILQLAITPIYIVFLYLGSLASWDGPLIVFLQHAFLTPVPFAG